MQEIPTAGWVAIAAVAGVLVILAVLHFGFHVFRRRRVRKPRHGEISTQGRVEVLESTQIDAERRLILVRCDGIEHLIMTGGPADVVVENDVKKVRGPGPAPARTPIPEPEKRVAARTPPATVAPAASPPQAAPKPAETIRPAARASIDARPAPAAPPPRSGLAAIAPNPLRTGGSSRTSEPPTPHAKADEPASTRATPPRPQSDQFGRRDATPPRRTTQIQPAPQHGSRGAELPRPQSGTLGAGRAARGSTRAAEEPAALPAAQIPWSDPDSIENEIVRALKFDPQIRGGEPAAARRESPSAKALTDSSTTLGDLADRLEEALAREVQSASQVRKVDIDLEDFDFDSDGETEKPAAQRDRPEKRERSEPTRGGMSPVPESEPRREPAAAGERREEAPVISLNSRRRDNTDPLEDEMARLLGELTGDTKGR